MLTRSFDCAFDSLCRVGEDLSIYCGSNRDTKVGLSKVDAAIRIGELGGDERSTEFNFSYLLSCNSWSEAVDQTGFKDLIDITHIEIVLLYHSAITLSTPNR